jgi:hypothetical protein
MAGNLTALSDFHNVEGTNNVIIHLDSAMTKNDVEHPSIIPRELYERIAQGAHTNDYSCPLPSYRYRWTQITKLAQRKYGVRLSHYFRKRFETRAEKIQANQMNPNPLMVRMGSPLTGSCRTCSLLWRIIGGWLNTRIISRQGSCLTAVRTTKNNGSEIQRLQAS